jgi:hypothetical protein
VTPSSLCTSTPYPPCALQQCALDAITLALLLLMHNVCCACPRLGLTVTWVPLPINVADAETWKGVALRCLPCRERTGHRCLAEVLLETTGHSATPSKSCLSGILRCDPLHGHDPQPKQACRVVLKGVLHRSAASLVPESAACCRYWQLDTYLLPVAEWETEKDGQQEAAEGDHDAPAPPAPAAEGS